MEGIDWTPLIAVLMSITAGINAWEVRQIIEIKEELARNANN